MLSLYEVNPLGSSLQSCVHFLTITPQFQAYTLTQYPYTVRIRLTVTLCFILPRFAI